MNEAKKKTYLHIARLFGIIVLLLVGLLIIGAIILLVTEMDKQNTQIHELQIKTNQVC